MVLLAIGAVASPSQAWWRGGVVVGVSPFYYGPAVVYPPPVVYAPPPTVIYAPPPVVYAPQGPVTDAPAQPGGPRVGGYAAAQARSCYAGPYVCPLSQPLGVGSGCACNDNYGQQIEGQAR